VLLTRSSGVSPYAPHSPAATVAEYTTFLNKDIWVPFA
jgi:hypothetical protein